MSVEKGLFQLIQSDTNVATIVTTTNGTGVYWILMPKGAAVPCVILSRVATDDTYSMAGSMKFRGALFQVDCYAASFYQSTALADIVRHLLESFKGALPDGTVSPFVSGTIVQGVQVTKNWSMPYEEGGKGFVYRELVEVRVWYQDN
jgi:hypothetical protein